MQEYKVKQQQNELEQLRREVAQLRDRGERAQEDLRIENDNLRERLT